MIKVIARSKIKTGSLPKVLVLYDELTQKTRKEEGCVSYELFQEVHDENSLTLIEEWNDLQALEKHTQTPHFIDLVDKLAAYETELPVLIYKKLL